MILIIFFSLYLVINKINFYKKEKISKNDVVQYLNNTSSINYIKISNNKNEYKAILEIPKLKIKRGLYDKSNKANNVNENITLISPNSFDSINTNTLVIAAHSGLSKISYFHNLKKLQRTDKVYIYYQGSKYVYSINKMYEVDKNGYLEINEDNNPKLYLTTCSEDNTNKQLVVLLDLIDVKEY